MSACAYSLEWVSLPTTVRISLGLRSPAANLPSSRYRKFWRDAPYVALLSQSESFRIASLSIAITSGCQLRPPADCTREGMIPTREERVSVREPAGYTDHGLRTFTPSIAALTGACNMLSSSPSSKSASSWATREIRSRGELQLATVDRSVGSLESEAGGGCQNRSRSSSGVVLAISYSSSESSAERDVSDRPLSGFLPRTGELWIISFSLEPSQV